MKLKYKILWVEDEEDSIKIKAKNIRLYLENEYGFECSLDDITILDYEEFETNYIDNNKMKIGTNIEQFDLVLVDFNLGEVQHTGDKLIKVVRDGNIYSEILFYSSDLDSLKEKLNKHFIDGIFTSNRDELEEKIKKLIRVTIKKVQDVNNLRGLIMAEVSELDRIKERIIVNATSKIDDRGLEKYMLKKVKSSIDANKNKLDEFNDNIDNLLITDLLNSRGLIDSDKKRLAVGKTLEKLSITEPIDKITFLEPYKNNILTIRNNFAHVEESDGFDEDGNTCKLIGSIPFTEKKCIEIRQEIKKYKNILVEIEQKLNE